MTFMRIAALAVATALVVPIPSFAWGFPAHRFIAERMIALLPDAIRPLFERRKDYIVERSVDPDLWRNVFPEEDPNHFVDLDYYGKYPYAELPREYDRAVQRWGREVVHEQGLLPWRAAEFFGKLQREFEGLKRENAPGYLQDNIALYSAILAHYVSDGHVPLHSVVNYDGQRTNQQGIHSRWESELFERSRERLTIAPAAPKPVQDAREFMFQVLLDSNRLAEGVLEADRKAAAGRQFYDDGYFAALSEDQFKVLEQRINDAITAVASIVIGAWEAAGRPPLPPERPRTFRPIKPSPPPPPPGFGEVGSTPPCATR
jgi:hypothetical protein